MLSLNNKYVHSIVLLFLFLYSPKAAPSLPQSIESLFKNDLFKVAFLTTIVYSWCGNVMFSIAVPLILIGIFNLLRIDVDDNLVEGSF